MAAIKHLTINFKGVSEAMELGKCTLLVGPNGSGKSARLQALQFAVQGDSVIGKRPEDVAKLATHGQCLVSVKLAGGYAWTRDLRRDPRTQSQSMGLAIAGHEGVGIRETEPMLAEKVGRFAPTFDLGEFLHLSDDKRRDFVLGLCGGAAGSAQAQANLPYRIDLGCLKELLGEGTVDTLCRERFGKSADELTSHDEMGQAAIALMTGLGDLQIKCLEEAAVTLLPELQGPITEAIAAALDKAKDLANASKRTKNQADQASRKLSEQKAGLEVRSEALPALKKEQEDLQEQRTQAREQIANQEGRAKARESLQLSIEQIVDAQNDASSKLGDMKVQEPTYPAIADTYEHEATHIEEANPKPEFDDSEAGARASEAHKAAETAESEKRKAKANVERLEARLERERDAEKRAKNDPWRKARELYRAILPVLKTAVSELYALGNHIHEQLGEECKTDWPAKVLATGVELEQARITHRSTVAESEKADEAYNAAHQAVVDLNREHAERMEAYRDATRDAEQKRREAQAIRTGLADHEREVERIESRLTELQNQRIDKERNLNSLDEEAGVPVETLQESVEGLTVRINSLEKAISDKQRYATLEEELTKCIASAEREAVMHETCKMLTNAIRTLREQLMHELVKPLIDRINRFLEHASPRHRAYCELENARGKPVLELGWSDGDRRTPLPAMSGGEAAMYGAGLAYALVTLADPPLKLLLLEAAELDPERLGFVLDALGKLSGDLDNVIVASCHGPCEYAIAAWDVKYLRAAAELPEPVAAGA